MLKPITLAFSLFAAPLAAQQCGGGFDAFVGELSVEAIDMGYSPTTVRAFFDGAELDKAVLTADRSQGFFQRDFIDFSRRLISQNRIEKGARRRSDRMQFLIGLRPSLAFHVVSCSRFGRSRQISAQCRAISTR